MKLDKVPVTGWRKKVMYLCLGIIALGAFLWFALLIGSLCFPHSELLSSWIPFIILAVYNLLFAFPGAVIVFLINKYYRKQNEAEICLSEVSDNEE